MKETDKIRFTALDAPLEQVASQVAGHEEEIKDIQSPKTVVDHSLKR